MCVWRAVSSALRLYMRDAKSGKDKFACQPSSYLAVRADHTALRTHILRLKTLVMIAVVVLNIVGPRRPSLPALHSAQTPR